MTHSITKIELRNLIDDTLVTPLSGVWAAGPDGKTGRLHLLGTNPFDWLSPHTDTYAWTYPLEGETVEQRFGLRSVRDPARGLRPPLRRRRGDGRSGFRTTHRLCTRPCDSCPADHRRLVPFLDVHWLRSHGGSCAALDDHRQARSSGSQYRGGRDRVLGGHGNVARKGSLPVYGDLHLVAVDVRDAPGQEVRITSTWKDAPFLVLGVRYHTGDHVLPGRPFARTLLVPARYRLTIEGNSEGVSSAGAPAPTPLAWSQTQEFEVRNPESLLPYIRMTTLGDPRVFGRVEDWNPMPTGTGIPGLSALPPGHALPRPVHGRHLRSHQDAGDVPHRDRGP